MERVGAKTKRACYEIKQHPKRSFVRRQHCTSCACIRVYGIMCAPHQSRINLARCEQNSTKKNQNCTISAFAWSRQNNFPKRRYQLFSPSLLRIDSRSVVLKNHASEAKPKPTLQKNKSMNNGHF